MAVVEIRQANATDYDKIIAVANNWWGRDVGPGLPRLFLDHFWTTSLVAQQASHMAGFLVGFYSPSEQHQAYIHYVAVSPTRRRGGLARRLYETYLEGAAASGCNTVRAITSPVNEESIAFHRRMGFSVTGPVTDYNGPGRDAVLFSRTLA